MLARQDLYYCTAWGQRPGFCVNVTLRPGRVPIFAIGKSSEKKQWNLSTFKLCKGAWRLGKSFEVPFYIVSLHLFGDFPTELIAFKICSRQGLILDHGKKFRNHAASHGGGFSKIKLLSIFRFYLRVFRCEGSANQINHILEFSPPLFWKCHIRRPLASRLLHHWIGAGHLYQLPGMVKFRQITHFRR